MSKTFKVVKEFEFPREAGYTGSSGQTMVKGYARGGKVAEMCGGGKYARGGKAQAERALGNERAEMARITRETRSERKDAGEEMKRVRREMQYDKAEMKQPIARKQYPVDRREPMIPMAMKKGGMTPKQQAKIGTVMGEFKSGSLHSGSKTGPEVTNRKQALAIAMSEARNVGKKK